jgi:hypothetical protein
LIFGEPGWFRTNDPVIKSHVLYRLSYGLECVDNARPYVGFAGFAQAIKRSPRIKEEAVVKRARLHHRLAASGQKLNDESSIMP